MNIKSTDISPSTQTIIFSDKQIKRNTLRLLNEEKISIYDVTVECLVGTAQDLVNKYQPRGFTIIIKHNEKSKILIYNK